MLLSADDRLGRARIVLERRGLAASDLLARPIAESWQRCLAGGLDPKHPPPLETLGGAAVREARECQAVLRRLAVGEMETLYHQIAGTNFMIALAAPGGMLLDTICDASFSETARATSIRPGTLWSEARCGTNALGTVAETGQAVTVHGGEHFFAQFAGLTCTAVPIRGPDGALAGVLDASSDCRSRQQHTQALVSMAAVQIENGLLRERYRGQVIIAFHSRAEYLHTLSAGLLAVDEAGVVLALNARAGLLLQGLPAMRGRRFEELFRTRLAVLLQAGRDDGRQLLQDRVGSVFAARLETFGRPRAVASPAPASLSPPAGSVAPGSVAPGSVAPGSVAPGSVAPGSVAPGFVAPGSVAPGSVAPGSVAPGFVAPGFVAPGFVAPGFVAPGFVAPGSVAPGFVAPGFVAEDVAVAKILRQVEAAARRKAAILLRGETGTGKEQLARHAHRTSGRSGAFIAVNCAALPDTLAEAELFGHAEGAFTGARRGGAAGLVAESDGGTLFLDEIGDMKFALQSLLLRLLDDWTVRPVGGGRQRRVDVLLVAATNVGLEAAVAAGRFRADLLYRLNTLDVTLPPLRERSDFATIAQHLLAEVAPQAAISREAVAVLARRPWPGNARELRSVLTRLTLADPQRMIDADALAHSGTDTAVPHAGAGARMEGSSLRALLAGRVRELHGALGGNVAETARRLGVSRNTVYRALRTP